MRRISLRNQPLFNRRGGGEGRGGSRRRIHEGGGGVRWFSAGTEGYQSWLREFKGRDH